MLNNQVCQDLDIYFYYQFRMKKVENISTFSLNHQQM